LNSVAGGGSFITFPALVFTGVPPVTANATSTVALWPGSLASVLAYRHDFPAERVLLRLMVGVSVVGGVAGAWLLLITPQSTFELLIPYLLLSATLLFALGGRLTSRASSNFGEEGAPSRPGLAGLGLLQLVVAVYGGYFGGGIGIIMLALLAMLGLKNLHTMNAMKTLLAGSINGVAVATFALANAVRWPEAGLMAVGTILGGYGGAYFAKRLNPKVVRWFVILVGLAMTAYFFYEAYN